ncbi:MAG TPA: energy transducer TonB [Steroidobacteraceae bacterium]|nr:energy transducer TonB [Steroidobacteraceae bacterium]
MAAHASHDTAFFSQRAMFLIAVFIVHVLLIWAFSSGLATRIIHVAEGPLETNIVQEVQKRDLPPPPPPPKMERPPVEVPPPDVVINIPVESTSTAITNTTTKHVEAPPPAPKPVVRTAPQQLNKLDPANFYPPTSIRMEEQGTVVIRVCWGADGKVSGTPTVDKTSKSSRLDEAAVRMGTQVRMKPGTVDGKPIEGCSTMPVKFVLN